MAARRALILVVALVATLIPVTPASAAELEWTFTGSGWGHGVGMSQYGAFGLALEGATAEEILSHYYSGATVDDLGNRSLPEWWVEPYEVRVNLVEGAGSVEIIARNGPAEVCRGDCGSPETLDAYQSMTVAASGDECTIDGGAPGTCAISVAWEDDGGTTRLSVDGLEYAHGTLLIDSSPSGNLNIVLLVALEEYLRGIAELPGFWPSAAQEAQAIAARNYAVRKVIERGEDGSAVCGCHLRDTTADQVYGGWAKEGIQPNRWVDAVEATPGAVAIHPSTGRVFTAYYSSSSGGATENNEDVWGGEPFAFLRSVEDRWALMPEVKNPNTEWSKTFSESKLEAILGWDTILDVELVAGPPGATVRFTGIDGGEEITRDHRGESLRIKFGLKSPWVSDVISPFGFADARSSVHAEDITFIADRGITKGCNPPDNNRFCPDQPVTRGQMAAFLVRTLELPSSDTDHFSDDDGSVFEGDINALATAGITRGCGEGRYCPDGPITREQMAAFLVRSFELTGADGVSFGDDDGSPFEAEIEALAGAGITKGCNPPENDRFCPRDPVTRGQMASFLARALRNQTG